MLKGTVVADGLVVARINVDFLRSPVKVHALAALVTTRGSQAGQTMAWTEGDGGVWSANTMAKLAELREAMEADLGAKVFGERTTSSTGPSATPQILQRAGGIGEHIGGDGPEAPSI